MKESLNSTNSHSEINDLEKLQKIGGFQILLHYVIFENLFSVFYAALHCAHK